MMMPRRTLVSLLDSLASVACLDHGVGTPSQTRFDRAVEFHPSGKLIFVTHNLDLDVYLSRE